ncbi:hypothetical protein [Rhizobium sp. NLR8a]|uniref:hypothetical protein n=1 Tax=Rhizobium sp. NLR8a TaxID=2731119 RepID=UPI002180ABD3|nr:hypothetical protein [Rhizobium sp. NLR8a]
MRLLDFLQAGRIGRLGSKKRIVLGAKPFQFLALVGERTGPLLRCLAPNAYHGIDTVLHRGRNGIVDRLADGRELLLHRSRQAGQIAFDTLDAAAERGLISAD